MAAVKIDSAVVAKVRAKRGENQTVFWNRLGITQSGGCRYESGRTIPPVVKKLFFLIYMTDVPLIASEVDWKSFGSIGRKKEK